jgi:hypothetical protein
MSLAVPASVPLYATSWVPLPPVIGFATNTGASLTGFTVMLMVATFESTVPSFALKEKLSEPL